MQIMIFTPRRYDFSPSDEELAEINEIFGSNFVVPENFEPTAAAYVEGEQPRRAFPVVSERLLKVAPLSKTSVTHTSKL